MKSQRMRAIVLRRTNYGEADRILQMLTPSGKRSVIARGVRREKSRLSGGIELFSICEVVIGEGKGDLGILTSTKLVKFYRKIMDDYDKMQFAYIAIKLATKSSEMVEGPEWYDVLSSTLAGLDSRTISFEIVQSWFYLHYAAIMGYELSLWHDDNGKDLSSDLKYRYDTSERGLRVASDGELSSDHIKLLRLISTRPLKVLAKIGGVENVITDCLLVAREHAAI